MDTYAFRFYNSFLVNTNLEISVIQILFFILVLYFSLFYTYKKKNISVFCPLGSKDKDRGVF